MKSEEHVQKSHSSQTSSLYIELLAEATGLGLNADELSKLCEALARQPSREEMAVCGALWSEHCSYKSSRPHLRRFHTTEPWVLQGPGENAGVYAVNDEWGIAFKMESHNHPSYIEPYQGAATGVGGILRDVFCMGARPLANLNCLRFGHGKWNGHLLKRVVEGIADYGNSVGIPTVSGDTQFHSMYSKNILVNAFTAGIIHKDKIFKGVLTDVSSSPDSAAQKASPSSAEAVAPKPLKAWPTEGMTGRKIDAELEQVLFPENENLLVYFGSATGRDGVHGATMSSATFTAGAQKLRPTVQVGDPFAEKVLLEATMALIASGTMVGLQDMGAAGLTSSSAEMAGRSGCGVAIDLSKVPLRASEMKAWEILLSESQERMLCAVKPSDLAKVTEILDGFDIPFNVIGKVNATGRFVCTYEGECCADLPVELLTDEAPIYHLSLASREDYLRKFQTVKKLTTEEDHHNAHSRRIDLELPSREMAENLNAKIAEGQITLKQLRNEMSSVFDAVIKETFASPAFCGRQALFEHYCATVGAQTVLAAGTFREGSSAVVRLPDEANCRPASRGAMQGIALAAGCSERHVQLDPLEGSAQSTALVARKIVATGGIPRALTDCLNFGSPRDPFVMRQISDSIDGINRVAKELKIPVVSGNVSLNNQTDGVPIPPTPMVGIVGDVADVRAVFPSRLSKNTSQHAKHFEVYALVPSQLQNHATYGISEVSLMWGGCNHGPVPRFDTHLEAKLWTATQQIQERLKPALCRPVGRGGLYLSALRTAIECWASFQSCEDLLALPATQAFAEGQTGFLMALSVEHETETHHHHHMPEFVKLGITNSTTELIRILPVGRLVQATASEFIDLDSLRLAPEEILRGLDPWFDGGQFPVTNTTDPRIKVPGNQFKQTQTH